MVIELNHSLPTSDAMIGELVGGTIVFLEDVKKEDLWDKVLTTNPIIDYFATSRAMFVP